jgi:hypothetical protein
MWGSQSWLPPAFSRRELEANSLMAEQHDCLPDNKSRTAPAARCGLAKRGTMPAG